AHALTQLTDKYRKVASTGRKDHGPKELKEYLEQLRGRIPGWLARVRAEVEEPVPAVPVQLPSHLHTIASMAVRASPTDAPGVIDVVLLCVQQATDTQQVLERTDLAATVCAKLTSADKTPDLVLREVTRCVLQLTDVALRRVHHLVQLEKHPNPDLAHNA